MQLVSAVSLSLVSVSAALAPPHALPRARRPAAPRAMTRMMSSSAAPAPAAAAEPDATSDGDAALGAWLPVGSIASLTGLSPTKVTRSGDRRITAASLEIVWSTTNYCLS
jgi:hypothetical protein